MRTCIPPAGGGDRKKTLVLRFFPNCGLGNQMFEIAAGLSLARALDIPLEWEWIPSAKRSFGLTAFGFAHIPATGAPVTCKGTSQGSRSSYLHVLEAVRNAPGGRVVVTSPFQSEDCFIDVASEVRELFRVAPASLPVPDGTTPVAVQVRRGDYVGHRNLDVTDRGYFNRAMGEVRKRIERPHFFVLSDDPAWCSATFHGARDVTVMPPQDPIDALRTIVACNACVISNSTFGWWGAWLSGSPVVVAPCPWYRGNYGDWKPVPDRWITAPTSVRTRTLEPFAHMPPPEIDRAIVYPWKMELAKWEELRYSLRSVERFFEDKECPIYILGNRRPPWLLLNSGRVRFIDRWSYREALETGVQLARKVLWMNDDIVMLKPTSWVDVETPLHQGEVTPVFAAKMDDEKNTWRKGMLRVIHDLKTVGKVDNPLIFSTHTPYVYERDKAVEMFRTYGVWDKMPLEMAYGNTYWRERAASVNGHKITSYPFGDARYLNHTDRLLTREVKDALKAMFPDFPPWELTLPFNA